MHYEVCLSHFDLFFFITYTISHKICIYISCALISFGHISKVFLWDLFYIFIHSYECMGSFTNLSALVL